MTINITPPGGSPAAATSGQLAQLRTDLGVNSTAEVAAALAGKSDTSHTHASYAPLASPALTGAPTAPTAAPGTNTTQIASTAFVTAAVAAGGGGGGGGGGTVDTTVTDGSANAVSGNAVFDELALKANKTSETLTSATLAGVTTLGGAVITTTTNMGAGTVIDITKLKQSKATSAAVPLSFSGTAAAGTTFGLEITNSDTSNAHTVTIPSSYSMARQALVTSFELPANGIAYIEWYFDGAVYRMQGDPVALSNKAIVGDFPTGANDTVVLVPYAPHGGTITAVVTDCVSGTATYQVFINGVALGAASSAVSTTQTTQTTTTARTFVAGDRITVVRTANATCVGGRITIVYAPTAP